MKHQNIKAWAKAALIRAARTIAQTALSLIGTTAVVLTDVNWKVVISGAILSGILSMLTSVITGLPEAEEVYIAWKR